MTKNELKKRLADLLIENPELATGNSNEVIYKIDDMYIYGGYEMGCRGYDHNILLQASGDYDTLCLLGTMVVPETKCYISNNVDCEYEQLGYKKVNM